MNNNMKDQFVLKEKKILIVKDDPDHADWKQILLVYTEFMKKSLIQ